MIYEVIKQFRNIAACFTGKLPVREPSVRKNHFSDRKKLQAELRGVCAKHCKSNIYFHCRISNILKCTQLIEAKKDISIYRFNFCLEMSS